MKLGHLQKRIIIKRVLLVIFLVYIGWFLKARLTPPAMGGMGGMGVGEPYVITKQVQFSDISPSKKYIGLVEAVKSVDLLPQVTGYVEEVLFKEGSLVNEGDILFIIEQERYLANVELRNAELKKAEAHLFQVGKDYKRQVSLNKQKYASELQLDNAKSALLQAEASVKQAKANLELAKIDINYTEIKAPITGHIGKALVTEGNYVNSSSQILARIVQEDPIRVVFSMSDKDFLNARKKLQDKETKINTKIILPNGDIIVNNLISRFADNEVNKNTATVAVYLEYENKHSMLIPGNYVTVLVSYSKPIHAVLIQQSAIAQDENGNYVYVVNEEGIAEERRVILGEVYENKQIVTEGLKDKDKVIINGLQKVKNGIKVKASEITETEEVK